MLRKLTLLGICLSLLTAATAWAELIVHGDGTVSDTTTGLMWQQDGAGRMSWAQALAYCEDLTLSVYDDWRLPNRNELQSLVDYSRYGPAIDGDFFPGVVSAKYWSSTTNATYPPSAWWVEFRYGSVFTESKSNSNYVRAVRGGQ